MNKKIQNQETIPDGAFLHEERLQLLSRATQSVIWDWDIEKGDIWRWEETHSQPPSTPQPQKFVAEFWKQQVAPHDRERVVESVYTALSGSALNWSCRYQIHRQNGAMATVADRALIIRNEDGSARRMLGSMVDIRIATPAGQFADRVQELHIKVIHILIELVERQMFPANYT